MFLGSDLGLTNEDVENPLIRAKGTSLPELK